jgi:hypothetical protein
MAKTRRKAAKSAKKSARKTPARVAKKRTIRGLTARTSGLVQMALGIRPKFTALPEDLHQQLIALYAGKRTPFLKLCGTSMAAKYLIVKVPSFGK